ncbi:hypothetical protein QDT91_29155 (plasmid) [Mycolicibacterium aubagnense]|uniref:hypothetical protein n=1 Tax=Mycolicibacterium aubagnense TaxID=319707 RepID=UPI0013F68C41|nr:hypothetical protein [Mycolicibacterium aubagnense]WGI36088.1 hypothetical protein QDT91_29155 [Mycolicibacterium aubagnense]
MDIDVSVGDECLDRFDPDECLDGPQGCQGEVHEYLAMSGSGLSYPRCERHQQVNEERLAPVMQGIRERYPEHPPEDFDPYFAGESWYSEDEVPR